MFLYFLREKDWWYGVAVTLFFGVSGQVSTIISKTNIKVVIYTIGVFAPKEVTT